jgi:hypothetical protein
MYTQIKRHTPIPTHQLKPDSLRSPASGFPQELDTLVAILLANIGGAPGRGDGDGEHDGRAEDEPEEPQPEAAVRVRGVVGRRDANENADTPEQKEYRSPEAVVSGGGVHRARRLHRSTT